MCHQNTVPRERLTVSEAGNEANVLKNKLINPFTETEHRTGIALHIKVTMEVNCGCHTEQ